MHQAVMSLGLEPLPRNLCRFSFLADYICRVETLERVPVTIRQRVRVVERYLGGYICETIDVTLIGGIRALQPKGIRVRIPFDALTAATGKRPRHDYSQLCSRTS